MFITRKMNQQNGSTQKTYHSGCVLPVLTAAELLSSSRHQGLLRQLRGMVFVEDEDYALFYEATINRFAEFVQVMPTVVSGPLSHLLNEGLSRATIVMKDYLAASSTIDPLLMYALFTAALYRDVARVVTNHRVVVCDEGGEYIDEWVALSGSMVNRADFYKLYPLAPIYQRLEKTMTPLLARQLMPAEGFLWIASDLQLYADWLDVLSGEEGRGGSVSHRLSALRPQDVYNLMNALVQIPVDMIPGIEAQYGDLFYAWLKEAIGKGAIAVNTVDASVHVTQDGVFLEIQKLVHQFAEATKLPVNMNAVVTQVGNLLGIAKKGGSDFLHAQYFSKYPTGNYDKSLAFSSPLSSQKRSLREGMVLGDPAMLFMNAQIPAVTDMLKAMQPKTASSHQLPTQSRQLGPSQFTKR